MTNSPRQPHFIEVTGPKEAPGNFKRLLQMARRSQPTGAAVTPLSVKEYKEHRLFLTPEGDAGFSVSPKGELASVFSTKGSGYKDVARHAAEHAVLLAGATHLSAFDPNLPEKYQRGGFKPVARVPFDPEYKPKGWEKAQGTPDVVFMAADREAAHPNTPRYSTGTAPETQGDNAYDDSMSKAQVQGERNTRRQLPAVFMGGHDGARL